MKPEEVYAEKKSFVEDDIAKVLGIYPSFEGIDYAVDASTGEEFVRIKDETNGPAFINITGNSLSAILQEVCRVCLMQRPMGLVTNAQTRRDIAPLFRREAQ